MELVLFADGNCNFLDASSEWYQVSCNGDGALVGKSRCDSDDCSSCILDITGDEAMPTDESCFTRPYGGKPGSNTDLDLKFKGTCAAGNGGNGNGNGNGNDGGTDGGSELASDDGSGDGSGSSMRRVRIAAFVATIAAAITF